MNNNEIKILLAILIIFILILITYIKSPTNLTQNSENSPFVGSQSKFEKIDCSSQTVYSSNDTQCSLICKSPNVYISKNGICVNALVNQSEITENKCSPEKGVLAYIVGDPQFGKSSIFCLSIDVGIQPNDTSKPNIICRNGNIDINYVKSFPEIKNCKCKTDEFLAKFKPTSTIREHAMCIDKKLINLFN